MANLFLDKQGALDVVGKVQTQISNLEEAARSIDLAIAGSLPSSWQGQSAEKAQSTYEESYKSFLTHQVPEMVASLNDYIKGCVEAIDEADRSLAGS